MKLTKKLLSLLHRVFDQDPEQFLALRISYSAAMSWTVSEAVLTTSVVGGPGQNLSVDLTTLSLGQLVDYVSAQPGYSVLYADGSGNLELSARVLIDGSGDIAQSNGDHLYAYTSLVWAYMESVGVELKAAKAQIPEAIKQMSIPTASSDWIDELGAYYGVPREQGENDGSYGARIIVETVRPRANNVAMEQAISYYTGQSTKVTDVTIYGDAFPKYNGAIKRNSAYSYQSQPTPRYGLFDVEIGYDLLGGADQSAFADTVAGIVDRLRAAGTHLRSLSMKSGSISDTFTPPVDGAMTLKATTVLADTLTAPTDNTFAIAGALGVMADTATAGTESAFDAIKYNYRYNGVRTRNGAIKYGGGTLETNPVVTKDWNLMTGILPGDINFIRASNAAYIDSNGVVRTAGVNQPRFQWDPATNALSGLLIEEARSNLLAYSTSLVGGDWTNILSGAATITAVANAGAAPDGTFTATRLDFSAKAVGDNQLRRLAVSTVPGSTLSAALWVRADAPTIIRLRTGDTSVGQELPVTKTWTRVFSTPGVNASSSFNFDVSRPLSTTAAGSIYVWRAQLEVGGVASSDMPSGESFTSRASTATYFDANGVLQTAGVDEARSSAFTYDAGVIKPIGLLLEDESTNIARQSNSATTILASNRASYVETSQRFVDGVSPLRLLREDTTEASTHYGLSAVVALAANTTYTMSYFVKAAGRSKLRLAASGSWVPSGPYCIYDLVAGTAVSSNGAKGTIQKFPDDIYRISLTATTGAAGSAYVYPYLMDNTALFYNGDGVSGIYIGGYQVEAGAFATSYIPTTTAAATRAADVSSSTSGSRSADRPTIDVLSPWFNANAGTMLIDCTDRGAATGDTFGLSLGADSTNYMALAYVAAGGPTALAYMRTAGGGPSIGPAGNPVNLRQVLAWDANGAALSNNGDQTIASAIPAGGIPPVANIRIGFSHFSTESAPMVLKRLTYWGTRFPDNTLPTLSTTTA